MLYIEGTLLYHLLVMKKEKSFYLMLKTQQKKFNPLIFFVIKFIFLSNIVQADVLKPNANIDPKQVVKIQLSALMNNDSPYKDRGILQTWEFAHPNNKKFTGPLEKFNKMIKDDAYSMLNNHKENEVNEVFLSKDVATYEVIILGKDKKYFKFKWQVEKILDEGPLKNCWMTTAVSQPIDLGSSI